MKLIFVLFSALIVNIRADDISLINDDAEFDYIFGDLINADYDTGVDGEEHETEIVQEEEPQLSDGIWKCGNCSNIDESKIVFSETLDLDTNYNENAGLELQIGFSVDSMRCIVIETGAINVRRVSGACAGEDVTLSVVQKSHIEVKVYE